MTSRSPFAVAALGAAALLLLAVAFVTGGDSIHRGWGETATQVLAVPVLLLAVAQWLAPPADRSRYVVLAVALAGPLVVAAQLLLGTTATPWLTERALLSWWPPVAAFLAALALPVPMQKAGLKLLAALVALHLVFAVLQLMAPQDSVLNPYPQRAPRLNGLFANVNHQATALAIGALLLLAQLFDGRDARQRGGRGLALRIARLGLAVLFLIALPLTGSRAMILIAAAALLALPLANGWFAGQLRRRRRRALLLLAPAAAAVAAIVLSAVGWLQVDRLEESRTQLAVQTAAMARDAMPYGTGAGSFVPWFEANMPSRMLQDEYYNHAHNEYVQWWLEGGVAGLAWIALVLAAFAWSRPRRAADGRRPDWCWVGSWLGVGCLLAHSLVDYPLRTPALATLGAWLAGVAVSAALRHRRGAGTTGAAGASRAGDTPAAIRDNL